MAVLPVPFYSLWLLHESYLERSNSSVCFLVGIRYLLCCVTLRIRSLCLEFQREQMWTKTEKFILPACKIRV